MGFQLRSKRTSCWVRNRRQSRSSVFCFFIFASPINKVHWRQTFAVDVRSSSTTGSEISDVRSQIWDLRSEILDLRSRIWDLRSEISDLRSQIWDLGIEIWDLRSEIWDLGSEIWDLRSEIWDQSAKSTSHLMIRCTSHLMMRCQKLIFVKPLDDSD